MSSTSAPGGIKPARWASRGRAPRKESAPSPWKYSQIRDCSTSDLSGATPEDEFVAAVAASLGRHGLRLEASLLAVRHDLLGTRHLERKPTDPVHDVSPRR